MAGQQEKNPADSFIPKEQKTAFLPRIMIGAGFSGSGKTTIVCGLLQALVSRGMKTASFKCGPDYIDPMFHTTVIGTSAKNLDTFFTDENRTKALFAKTAQNAEFSVMEGVMGFYDGAGVTEMKASSYDLARVTETPVVLVVNAKGMSLSAVAYIKGFLEYKKDSFIKGVIFNEMSEMVYQAIKPVVEQQLGIQVLGYVPKLEDCAVKSRHLGLVTPAEIGFLKEKLTRLAACMEQTVDIDGLLELGRKAPPLSWMEEQVLPVCKKGQVKIAVAKDAAFCFYYEDNLQLLRDLGAELVFFSPLEDARLPEGINGCLLGGGYPELYAEQLSGNETIKESIRTAILAGLPYMAECGGFMYLHETMEDMEKNCYEMAGIIPGRVFYTGKLGRFGYICLEPADTSHQEEVPVLMKGHEFHYFDSTCNGSDYIARKPFGKRNWPCMHKTGHSLVGFPHLYYPSNPKVAEWFVKNCRTYKDLQRV